MKKNDKYIARFLATALMFTVTAGVVAIMTAQRNTDIIGVSSEIKARPRVIVIDPGHGGEDPGASSDTGVAEKDLNLTISDLCAVLFKSAGYDVKKTRSDDRMVYDMYGELVDYSGRKKVYDLKNRIRFAEENNSDIFVSIHMNKFFQPQYRGLQVYYSPNGSSSEHFASTVQSTVKSHLQPGNERQIKEATSSIYLLDNIKRNAVLIECGFLSNPKDLKDLTTPSYQLDLSAAICSAISNAFDNSKESAG